MKKSLIILLLAFTLVGLFSCKGHEHSFGDSYSYNDSMHWHECECGSKSNVETHTWNSGVVTTKPTADSKGERTYTCTVDLQGVEQKQNVARENEHTVADTGGNARHTDDKFVKEG